MLEKIKRIEKFKPNNFVEVKEVLPSDFPEIEGKKIEVPEYAFNPKDPWTKTFLEGLQKVEIKGKTIVEIGAGSGINSIYLLLRGADKVIGTDINPRVIELAKKNIKNVMGEEGLEKCDFITGDLLSFFKSSKEQKLKADTIIGCIPQVVVPPEIKLLEKDNIANYYDPEKTRSSLDIFSLGLNETLLRQAKEILPSGGRVVLNLGGRPSLKILENMFRKNNFEPGIIYKKIISQDPSTSLEELAKVEKNCPKKFDFNFEFFEDEKGEKRINAEEAEKRRKEGNSVYHFIYVIEGTLKKQEKF